MKIVPLRQSQKPDLRFLFNTQIEGKFFTQLRYPLTERPPTSVTTSPGLRLTILWGQARVPGTLA